MNNVSFPSSIISKICVWGRQSHRPKWPPTVRLIQPFPKLEEENEQGDGDTEETMESSMGVKWNVLRHWNASEIWLEVPWLVEMYEIALSWFWIFWNGNSAAVKGDVEWCVRVFSFGWKMTFYIFPLLSKKKKVWCRANSSAKPKKQISDTKCVWAQW